MKLCKDCKHVEYYGYGRRPMCIHPKAPVDPVNGEKDGSCSLMRSRNCCIPQCGYEGDWFEQAPPPEQQPSPIVDLPPPDIRVGFWQRIFG